MMCPIQVTSLIGKTRVAIDVGVYQEEVVEIIFSTECGSKYKLSRTCKHYDDVYLYDIHGDIGNLVGSPVLYAVEREEEMYNDNEVETVQVESSETTNWMFYRFATYQGFVDMRWKRGEDGDVSFTDCTDKVLH